MKHLQRILLISLTLALLLSACGPLAPAETSLPPQVFTDDLGRQVTLSGVPQRIISLAPSISEVLFAIGAGPRVIARDDFSNYPPEVAALPSIGGASAYNLEEITRLQPDLVLAAEINSAEQVKAIEDLGIPVFYVKNPPQLMDGLYEELRTVAQLTGSETEAETLILSMQARVQRVQTALQGVESRPVVYYELDATDPAKPFTAGPGTYIDMLIQLAGGENFGAILDSQWAQISMEQLILSDPDFILLGDANYGTTPAMVAARPGWEDLAAVQAGQVLGFDDDTVSRPGPRLVDGLVELVKIIHPELAAGLE